MELGDVKGDRADVLQRSAHEPIAQAWREIREALRQ